MSSRQVSAGVLRERVRTARLRVRRLDAQARALPDFLVIGAQKAGTTSLYESLAGHPGVEPAARKEVHYFDLNYEQGEQWYRAMFPRRSALRHQHRARAITGEASPYYLFHPLAPARAAALVPDARLVVVLRDPVQRAWSHYRHEVAAGREQLPFAAALDAEPERLAGSGQAIRAGWSGESVHRHRTASYCARGRYAAQLRQWFEHFPRSSVHIVLTDDLFARPGEVLTGLADFLQLDDDFATPFPRRNAGPDEAMDEAVARRLGEQFREDNQDLERLLGRRLGWTGLS